ncbi:MAG: glucose-1-phosphate adenylyltransferase [Candidatus Neomarinimicrobiota bacterium]|nr:MAG: glucose-1-phosphate adenylyltransferase [Candidatus Neomarinimicrobiota bacterium]
MRKHELAAIVLGGGRGERLWPLTKERAKPAVPIAGKYRLIDIPLSNCINSGVHQIYILTQINTGSLHRHIFQSYKFDIFSGGNVEILPAQQTLERTDWFQGTADAVRAYWDRFERIQADRYLILAGDHLYAMNYRDFLRVHRETEGDLTVAAMPVPVEEAHRFGILKTDESGRITHFVEKPRDPKLLKEFSRTIQGRPMVMASLGIYLFRKDVLRDALRFSGNDFGKNIIPEALQHFRATVFSFEQYWEDIGTIGAFYRANMELTRPNPSFSFFDVVHPMYTRSRFLPGSQVRRAEITDSIINEGCRIGRASIANSVVGIRSVIGDDVRLDSVYMMGADYYASAPEVPPVGVGDGSVLSRVILDKNVRLGKGVRLVNERRVEREDGAYYAIRDGIIVIPKNTVVPDGTVL